MKNKHIDTHWMPRVAGIINLVLAGPTLILGLWFIVDGYTTIEKNPDYLEIIAGYFCIFLCIFPLLSGIFALQRKHWVAAMVLSFFMCPSTLLSMILLGLSKQEFQAGTKTNQT